ncbi:hypothetical protein MAR_037783, partial [Mya arenaria]
YSGIKKSLEQATSNEEKHIILCGNFNCSDIDWQSLTRSKKSYQSLQLTSTSLMSILNQQGKQHPRYGLHLKHIPYKIN